MDFEIFKNNVPLIWLCLSFFFLLMELFLPTAYFLWIGLGAFLTAAIGYFGQLGETIQLVIFALSSVIFSIAGKKFYTPYDENKDSQNLNNKQAQIVGRKFVLEHPILNEKGRLQVGDSQWTIKGPNLPKGTSVIVKAIEGNVLLVEKADP